MGQPLVHVRCDNPECTYFDQVRTVPMLAVGAGVFQSGGLYCECRDDREIKRVSAPSADDGRAEPPGATYIDHRVEETEPVASTPPDAQTVGSTPLDELTTTADQVGRTE